MQRYAPPPLQPPQVFSGLIPKGYPGTQKTVDHVQALIRQGAKDFYVRQKAIDILLEKGIKPKDYLSEIRTLFEWVQQNVRYTKDPFRVEVLHTPKRMLELRAGDCDDMTILLGAMLEAIGHPVRLVLTGPDSLRPNFFSHIYLEAYFQGRWIALDATMPYPMGWEPQTPVKKVFPIHRSVSPSPSIPQIQGFGEAANPSNWLPNLLQSIQLQGLQPRDRRIKALWELLRHRQLLHHSPRLREGLRSAWHRGISQPLPQTAMKLSQIFQRWGILPVPIANPSLAGDSSRMLQPVQVKTLRPVAVRPVRLVNVQPVARVTHQ